MVMTSTGLVSGCLDTVGLDDSDSPAYERWLQTDHDGIEFRYVDWESVRSLEDVDTDFEAAMANANVNDSRLMEASSLVFEWSLGGLYSLASGTSMGLVGTGLEGVVYTAGGEEDGTIEYGDDFMSVEVEIRSFESTVDELLMVDHAMIITGEIDVSEVGERITEGPNNAFGVKFEYERTDDIGDYECYEVVENDHPLTSPHELLAVSEEAIIGSRFISADTRDAVREPIDTIVESDGTAIDGELESLLETAGHGDIVVGGYDHTESQTTESTDNQYGEGRVEEETGFVTSLELEDSAVTNGAFAATFGDLDDETEATLESELDTPDGNVDIDIDDGRATASVVWDEPVLE
ncbi:hypothetical protein AB7C87_04540 [Natrarchaeobius sp. A-rgal3]